MVKEVAKHIISCPPISVESSFFHAPHGVQRFVEYIDLKTQNWSLAQSDRFTTDEWKDIQIQKLQSLFVHAKEHIPYWKKVFASTGFDPYTFAHFSDMRKLPITSRASVKKMNIDDITAQELFVQRAVKAHTSGSTSEPLTFYQDRRDVLRRRVNTSQEFLYAFGHTEAHTPVMVMGLEPHRDLADFQPHFKIAELEDETFRKNEIYPYIEMHRPVLIATASAVRRLESLARYDNKKVTLRGIFYRGEHIDASTKDQLAAFFRCELFTTYGSSECSLLGIECSYHRLHVAPWMNYIEVLDDQGLPVPDGKEGTIVVTFLENYVMPFIRYRVGDIGSLTNEPCPCGRRTHTIRFSGRQQEMIHLPNGVDFPLLHLTKFVTDNYSADISQYQFLLSGETLTFNYVSDSITADVHRVLENYFLSQLQNMLRVRIVRVPHILPGENGKTPLLVRR